MSSGDSRSDTTKSTEISIASSRGKSRPPTRFSHGSRSWSIECRIPGNLCDLSKGYFATTFLSSNLTCPATQSGLYGAFIPFMGFASSAVRFNGRARRVQSVPHRQRSKPQASNTRASGSQMSGNGYGSWDRVQAPLTLITAFGRLASSSTFGRSAQGCGGAGGTRGCMMPRWSMMNRVSGWRSMSAVPASKLPQHRMLTGKSWRTAARRIRSRPGSFGSRFASFVSMMRIPTAPGVILPVGDDIGHRRIVRVDRLNDGEPVGMGPLLHFQRIVGVVAVHGKGGDEDRAVDADFVHRRHHLVTRDVIFGTVC